MQGFLLTFQDVTEMRRLERDARTRQRLAAVGDGRGHRCTRFTNPLASMRGSIQVLRCRAATSQTSRRA